MDKLTKTDYFNMFLTGVNATVFVWVVWYSWGKF